MEFSSSYSYTFNFIINDLNQEKNILLLFEIFLHLKRNK